MAGRDESLFVCPKEQQQELLVALNPQRDVEVDLNLKVDVTPIPPPARSPDMGTRKTKTIQLFAR